MELRVRRPAPHRRDALRGQQREFGRLDGGRQLVLDLLRPLEAHARALAALGGEQARIDAFALVRCAEPSLSHAAPVDPVEDADALRRNVAAVVDAMRAQGLRPRVELSLLLWPDVPPLLAEAGLVVDEETPLLIVRRSSFLPRPGGAWVRWVNETDDTGFIGSVMRQGLELRGGPPSAADIAELRAHLEAGLRLGYAEVDGRPAATGCSFPIGPATEISAVSTLPTLRRRGVASALVSFLLAEHFAAGGELAWAATDDPAAHGLLQRLGFDDAGLRVSFVAP